MSHVIHANDNSFHSEVIESDKPVLVDFWAQWCGPCRMVGPVVEELADEYKGRAKVVKVNTEEAYITPEQYAVRGIPTLLVFKNGKVVGQTVGAAPKSVLANMLNSALESN